MRKAAAILVVVLAGLATRTPSQSIWQADLQIRGLSVSQKKGNLAAHVIVASEFGEAMAARLEIMLPVGVGLLEFSPGCSAGPNPSGVSDLRARVICQMGDLPSRATREFDVLTTTPPPGIARGFAVVALSDTPDPRPGNNFAEKALPRE